jgi:hypothetical protein
MNCEWDCAVVVVLVLRLMIDRSSTGIFVLWLLVCDCEKIPDSRRTLVVSLRSEGVQNRDFAGTNDT